MTTQALRSNRQRASQRGAHNVRVGLVVCCFVFLAGTAWGQSPRSHFPNLPNNVQVEPLQRGVLPVAASPLDTAVGDPILQKLAESHRLDATLHSVATAGPDVVCAVGDVGAIWLTRNGGHQWQVVKSGTIANLHGIVFLDELRGVAVGGEIGNAVGSSRGEVLITRDGGQSWEKIPHNLPRLVGLQLAGKGLLAWGDYSSVHGTSVFWSADGGMRWTPVRLPLGHAAAGTAAMPIGKIFAVDRLGRGGLAAIGAGNAEGHLTTGTLTRDGPLRGIRCVLSVDGRWLAAGENGRLLGSADGINWQEVAVPLAPQARRWIRWQTIARTGTHLWIGGSPGSVLLHSPDHGRSWEVVYTGGSLPIESIAFWDEQRGWAVGCFAQILATRDGGRTWYPQAGGNRRAGLLVCARSGEDVPWSSVVAANWDGPLRTAVSVTGDGDLVAEANYLPSPTMQYAATAPRVGTHFDKSPDPFTAVSTPFGHADELTATGTDRSVDPNASAISAAVSLSTWRPAIVLVPEAEAGRWQKALGTSASAAKQPDDDSEINTILKQLGMSPWRPAKLVAYARSSKHLPLGVRSFSDNPHRFLHRLSLSAWDLLLGLPIASLDQDRAVQMWTVWTSTQNRAALDSLLGGVPISSAVKRAGEVPSLGNYQMVMARPHRVAAFERLAEMAAEPAEWETALKFLLKTAPPREAVWMMQQLALRLNVPEHQGRLDIVLHRLVAQRVNNDLRMWAALELLKQHGSEEYLVWSRLDGAAGAADELSPGGVQPSEAGSVVSAAGTDVQMGHSMLDPLVTSPFESASPAGGNNSPEELKPQPDVQPAVFRGQVRVDESIVVRRRAERWLELLSRLGEELPELASLPPTLLMAAAAEQRTSHPVQVDARLRRLLESGQLAGWTQVALQERWQRSGVAQRPKWFILAKAAEERPTLDGHLQESCWQSAPATMRLSDLAGDTFAVTEIRWAFDEEYLYLAGRSPWYEGQSQRPLAHERRYDADLHQIDHIELRIDVDRDYATAFQLGVACDGQTFDRCDHAIGYNPRWHVAVRQGSEAWWFEVAIPRSSLTVQPVLGGTAWAVAARRLGPGVPTQSWGVLRTHELLPQNCALVVFPDSQVFQDKQQVRTSAGDASQVAGDGGATND